MDLYTDSEDSEVPQRSLGKISHNSKELAAPLESGKDTSSDRGYNEQDEGMETRGDSTKVEENIRADEGKERRKSKRNIIIKVPSRREKDATGSVKKKR